MFRMRCEVFIPNIKNTMPLAAAPLSTVHNTTITLCGSKTHHRGEVNERMARTGRSVYGGAPRVGSDCSGLPFRRSRYGCRRECRSPRRVGVSSLPRNGRQRARRSQITLCMMNRSRYRFITQAMTTAAKVAERIEAHNANRSCVTTNAIPAANNENGKAGTMLAVNAIHLRRALLARVPMPKRTGIRSRQSRGSM